MAPILKSYKVTVGAGTATPSAYHFLQAPLSYEGSLDTVTGVVETPQAEQDMPLYKVSELLAKNIVIRMVVRYEVAGKRKTSRILVAKDKMGTALDDLIGKSFRLGQISKAYVPRKASTR